MLFNHRVELFAQDGPRPKLIAITHIATNSGEPCGSGRKASSLDLAELCIDSHREKGRGQSQAAPCGGSYRVFMVQVACTVRRQWERLHENMAFPTCWTPARVSARCRTLHRTRAAISTWDSQTVPAACSAPHRGAARLQQPLTAPGPPSFTHAHSGQSQTQHLSALHLHLEQYAALLNAYPSYSYI